MIRFSANHAAGRIAMVVVAIVFSWCREGIVDAHPISLSSTTVDLRPKGLKATVEIMLEDLVLYHEVPTSDGSRNASKLLLEAADQHREFLAQYLTFQDGRGQPIQCDVRVDDASAITEEGVAPEDLMSRSVIYELTASCDQPIKFLTIQQLFGGADAVLPAVMDVMILQQGHLIERPVQLTHGRPHTIQLDWAREPHASAGLAALRQRKRDEFQKRLGISSYGGLYSFLYIDRYEVRHEILIPFLTLGKWIPLPVGGDSRITVQEQELCREAIADFLRKQSDVRVDGSEIKPEKTRIRFFGLDANDFAIGAEPRELSTAQARVGIILSYPCPKRVSKVEMHWSAFNEFAPFMKTSILAEDEQPRTHLFRESSQPLIWQRQPVADHDAQTADTGLEPDIVEVRVGNGGSRTLTNPYAADRSSVTQLLWNVYRSFQRRHDADIYDALATSVTQSYLPEVYLQVKRALVMAEQGSELARVSHVKVLQLEAIEMETKSSQRCRCRWTVDGTMEHWGHVHTRVIEYDATLSFQIENGSLKLAKIEMNQIRQLQQQTRLRQWK